jgi:hypothetical protein
MMLANKHADVLLLQQAHQAAADKLALTRMEERIYIQKELVRIAAESTVTIV